MTAVATMTIRRESGDLRILVSAVLTAEPPGTPYDFDCDQLHATDAETGADVELSSNEEDEVLIALVREANERAEDAYFERGEQLRDWKLEGEL